MDVGAPLPFSQRVTPRQWLALDGAWALLTATVTVGAIVIGGETGPVGRGWDVVRVVVTVVACAALPLRRAYPRQVLAGTAVLVAALVALGVHGPVTIVVALALYTVAATSDRRLPVVVVGSVIAVVGLGALVTHGGPDWGAAVSGAAIALVGWLAGENTRTRRAYVRAVAERATERELEREERVLRAAHDERMRIARELHDIVAHAMSVVTVRAGVARVVLDAQPEEARRALSIIETTSRRALQEMRLIVDVLRQGDDAPAELGPTPGLADIDQLIAQVSQAGVQVRTRTEGTIRPLPPGVDLSAYRIIQEALTNVVRHAGPSTANLCLRFKPDELEIELTNGGRGGSSLPIRPANPGGGHGLVGMRERVALYGGQFSAAPTDDGFKVLVELPTIDDAPVTIGVVIADDQALVRGGFRVLIDAAPDMHVLGEATDGANAVSLTRRHHPDVVLMDIRMPGVDGIEATRRIKADKSTATVRVLILTTFDLDEYVYSALRAGASGFMLKDTSPEELLTGIRVIAAGDGLLSPTVTRRLIERFTTRPDPILPDSNVMALLTDHEREVLVEVAHGLSNAEIAARLHMSAATAKTHVSRLFAKLGARDRAQLVVIAYEKGLASPR